MRSLPVLLLASVASLAAGSAFADPDSTPDLSKLPPASTQAGVTYLTDIRPLFEASCFRCHGEQRHKGDIRLDSLEAVLKGGEDGKIVVPGDSAKSQLVISVARIDPDSAMPPSRKGGGHKDGPPAGGPPGGGPAGGPPGGGPPPAKSLTAEQVGLVRAWIDQGAK